MPRASIDWKSTDSYTRLLAAMVAAQDMKLNYKKIADMYGEGATYDAIEGRFRIIKKEAAKLKEEIESGKRPEAPPRGKTLSPRKPQQSGDGVLSGRVSKSANSTPTKKRTTTHLKQNIYDSSTSSSSPRTSTPSFPVSEGSLYISNPLESFGTAAEMSFDLMADEPYIDGWHDDSIA